MGQLVPPLFFNEDGLGIKNPREAGISKEN